MPREQSDRFLGCIHPKWRKHSDMTPVTNRICDSTTFEDTDCVTSLPAATAASKPIGPAPTIAIFIVAEQFSIGKKLKNSRIKKPLLVEEKKSDSGSGLPLSVSIYGATNRRTRPDKGLDSGTTNLGKSYSVKSPFSASKT